MKFIFTNRENQPPKISHEEVDEAVRRFLKSGGKIQRKEPEDPAAELNLAMGTEWEDYRLHD